MYAYIYILMLVVTTYARPTSDAERDALLEAEIKLHTGVSDELWQRFNAETEELVNKMIQKDKDDAKKEKQMKTVRQVFKDYVTKLMEKTFEGVAKFSKVSDPSKLKEDKSVKDLTKGIDDYKLDFSTALQTFDPDGTMGSIHEFSQGIQDAYTETATEIQSKYAETVNDMVDSLMEEYKTDGKKYPDMLKEKSLKGWDQVSNDIEKSFGNLDKRMTAAAAKEKAPKSSKKPSKKSSVSLKDATTDLEAGPSAEESFKNLAASNTQTTGGKRSARPADTETKGGMKPVEL